MALDFEHIPINLESHTNIRLEATGSKQSLNIKAKRLVKTYRIKIYSNDFND